MPALGEKREGSGRGSREGEEERDEVKEWECSIRNVIQTLPLPSPSTVPVPVHAMQYSWEGNFLSDLPQCLEYCNTIAGSFLNNSKYKITKK